MRESRLVSVVRRDKKILIIGMLLFYIFYQKISSQDCYEAWTDTDQEVSSEYDKFEYTVLIASKPSNLARRASIRRSWMKLAAVDPTINLEDQKHKMVKFFFVIGTSRLGEADKLLLMKENSNNQDLLIFDDLVDSYSALTTKMLWSLKWISNNMKGLRYLIKCDDDSFVRIDRIVHNLENFAPSMDALALREYVSHQDHYYYKGLYWGYFNGRARVFKSGKWEENDWFLCDRYLPYALGGAYVISRNIVDFIARNEKDLSLYNSEDVSMGVWTSALDKINRVHDLRFDTSATSRGCSDHMLVRHKVSTSSMTEIYKTLVDSNGEKLCKDEGVKNYYSYNWNVMPSMCCQIVK